MVDCEEKETLTKDYGNAAEIFGLAMKELLAKMGASQKPEFERMRYATEHARINMEQARWNLERHILDHGC
jgi:hypothetical protein